MAGKQLNFRVPEGDPSREWIEAQDNLSTSLKLLIRRVMAHTGAIDFPGALADGLLDSMFEQQVDQSEVVVVKKPKVARKSRTKKAPVIQSVEPDVVPTEDAIASDAVVIEPQDKSETIINEPEPKSDILKQAKPIESVSLPKTDDISSLILGASSANNHSILDDLIAKSNDENN